MMSTTQRVLSALAATVIVASTALAAETEPAADARHESLVPAPRLEKWWFALHAERIGDMAEKDIDLLMIGDSITHGFDSVGAKYWKEVFEPRKAINLGFGGDRTQHVLWRL